MRTKSLQKMTTAAKEKTLNKKMLM